MDLIHEFLEKAETHMSYVSWLGLFLSVIAGLAITASGPGYRLGLWKFKTGISLVKFSGWMSIPALILCLFGIAIWRWTASSGGFAPSLIGFLIGGTVLSLTLKWKHNLDSVPYIHDITTDTDNPPLFAAILPLRADAENPSVYGGPDVARQQKAGYPHLHAGIVSRKPDAVFPQALQAAKDMGWEIVSFDRGALRIEATDTTAWFGFKDDVVVRLSAIPAGSRIDVRSVSRVGKSDLGTNAGRINAYLARVE